MEWIVGFVLGIIADIFRSVFVPASTDWINRLIPLADKKPMLMKTFCPQYNGKLQPLEKDPNLPDMLVTITLNS